MEHIRVPRLGLGIRIKEFHFLFIIPHTQTLTVGARPVPAPALCGLVPAVRPLPQRGALNEPSRVSLRRMRQPPAQRSRRPAPRCAAVRQKGSALRLGPRAHCSLRKTMPAMQRPRSSSTSTNAAVAHHPKPAHSAAKGVPVFPRSGAPDYCRRAALGVGCAPRCGVFPLRWRKGGGHLLRTLRDAGTSSASRNQFWTTRLAARARPASARCDPCGVGPRGESSWRAQAHQPGTATAPAVVLQACARAKRVNHNERLGRVFARGEGKACFAFLAGPHLENESVSR